MDRAYSALDAMLNLSDLSAPTRELIQDASYRAVLTTALLQAVPSSPEAVSARDAIDAAVVEILAAAGLPRGSINGLVVEHVGRTWFGRKAPDCILWIDVEAFSLLHEEEQSDSLIRTGFMSRCMLDSRIRRNFCVSREKRVATRRG